MIAISYRHEDSLPVAGRLYDRLQTKFGKKNVFMDFDSIPPGADFRQHIKQMIERSKLVIAIIGPHWLGEQPDASRRIDDPADFVRLEIAYALEGGIPVIPLLVNTTQMPKPEMLPPDIQELAFRHALSLDTGMDFNSHAERLITGINKAIAVAPRLGGRHKIAEPMAPAANARRLRKIVIWSNAILLAGAASAIWFFIVHRHVQEANGTRQALVVEQPKPAKAEAADIGGVKVNTSPPGATVTLGHWTKQAPATFNANSGKYSLFVELDGYEPVAKEVEAKGGQLTDLGTITLQRGKSRIDLSTEPPGAKVLQGQNSLGVTPLRNIEFPSGRTTFLLVLEGYLPREFKAQLISKELFKAAVALAKPLPLYEGTIQASQGSVPLTIKLGADLKSGTMTQSSTRGDTVVKFTGVWDGATLRAKTQKVVSQPEGILWEPESFTLRFSDDGKAADYECNYGTEIFRAILSAP
jgi:hypothetical protein